MADEKPPEEDAPAKPGLLKRIPWFLLLAITNVVVVSVSGYLFWSSTLGKKSTAITDKEAKEALYASDIFEDKPIVYTLEPFTVNLGGEQDRIIQVEVALEMIDEQGFEEVVTMGGHARDTIVNILNGKNYKQISSIQGKLYLKDEIIVALNEHLEQSFIKDIYFSRFMIQEI